jgi:2-methylcitrate dehydratase PrpD
MAQAVGGISGPQLITAVAHAIDVEARLIRPVHPSFFSGRVATNATFAFGNYGAAIVASGICGLDAAGFANALGLVHGQASGYLQGQVEGRGVSIQCGYAVRNGITAARLAQHGLEGAEAWLTGRAGLYAALFAGSDIDPSTIVGDLGQEYLGIDLAFKAYPCGIVAHPALDAAASVREFIGTRMVEGIQIDGPASIRIMAEPIDVKRSPQTGVEAQFSLPWAMACVLRDGELTVDHCNQSAVCESRWRVGVSGDRVA